MFGFLLVSLLEFKKPICYEEICFDYLEMQDDLSTLQVTVDIISTQRPSIHTIIVLRAYLNKTQIFCLLIIY